MVIVLLIVWGLCLGSFVNALVWRVYKQQTLKSTKLRKDYSITTGRSMCMNCKHELAAKDLIPVVSWIMLRGRCRYCHVKFADTPVTELVVPVLLVISYVFWPFDWSNSGIILFALWSLIQVGFVALAVYDLRWFRLPNRMVYPLQVLGMILATVGVLAFPGVYSIKDVALGLLFSAGLFWTLYTISKGKWIGYGDVRLAVVIGLVLGRGDLALLMLFVASLLGSAVAIPLLVAGKANRATKLPFGPYLILATIIVFLFGTSLIDWYKTQFLFL